MRSRSLSCRGRELLSGDSPDGLLWAIGARCDEEDIVLVANLDAEQREITVLIGDPAGAERVESDNSPARAVRVQPRRTRSVTFARGAAAM